jgi:lipopolysaccharide/colanic/teichoic acid biosynthesis glycosyltransferase/glycosyltransferase involved in cell wall biosynthesis
MTKRLGLPRIAHVTTADVSVRFLLLNQLLYLREKGYEVAAVCSDGPWLADVRALGFEVQTVTMKRAMTPFSDLIALGRLYRCFRRSGFDLVHTHTPKGNLLGQLAAWLARTPYRVITIHGFYFHDAMPKWNRRFYIFMEKISSRCAHWIFSQNREDMATAVREGISPESKMHFLGNGIDLKIFQREKYADAAARLRIEMGIPPSAPVVGILGRLTFEKGYREFFEAASIIRQKHGDTHFVIVGPDDVICKNELDGLVEKFNLRACVHFCGMQVDVGKFYSMMTCFLFPSYREGMPRVLMEAAAMSIPAVASDIRGCREVIDSGKTGILVPVRNASLAATAVIDLLDNPAQAQAMGKAARCKAELEFDERAVFNRVHEGYSRLIELKGALGGGKAARTGKKRPFFSFLIKRLFDLVTSALGLIFISPILILISIVTKLNGPGPVFFRQVRPGMNGKPFTLFKFRTMIEKRDEMGKMLPDEQRLTSLGRFMRSTSLDELPELVNVLKGEMSLVGPRPLLTQYLPLYTQEQNRRHEVRPGITGWAQINGRNALTWEEKFRLDVWYVDHWSFFLDIMILFKTLLKLVTREGISAEGYATMPEFRGTGQDQQ